MREIKFRAWDRKKKELFPVHEIRLNPNGGNLIEIKGYDDWDSDGWTVHGGTRMMYANEDRYILNQFTGLKDSNGREIYEGDIYHQGDENIRYVVVYHDTSFIGKQLRSSSFAGLEYWRDQIEVIGNIYENPELIKGVNA